MPLIHKDVAQVPVVHKELPELTDLVAAGVLKSGPHILSLNSGVCMQFVFFTTSPFKAFSNTDMLISNSYDTNEDCWLGCYLRKRKRILK